jgi:adenylate cyclase
MQDVPQERWGADAPPSGEAMSPVCFAGLVFDLGACALVRESGEAIPLTRGEFRLLRLFVSRPGRVLSRDAILEVVANRPLELFDRSVDALVARLRRKIEPDPKAPRLIVTVPGEGYRFDALAPAPRGAPVNSVVEPYPRVGADAAAEAEAARAADPAQPNSAPPPPSAATVHGPMRLWRRLPTAAALFVALFAAGAYGWRSGLAPRFMGTVAEDKLVAAPRLSIVVLPFENLSADKEQDYFADGIAEDLTTDLSHLPDSFVIARGTAFTYKGKPVDAKQIGKDLGVRYLLEGSARRVGEKITINAQLVSTETGAHVWADRFEGDRSKLGELQVEAVSRLANSLGAELVKAEALRATRERLSNPDAVDLAMRGTAIMNGPESLASVNEAIGLFERALSLDAKNVQALIGLSWALADRANNFADDAAAADIAHAEKAVDAALVIQPDSSAAHLQKSYVYQVKHQWGPAIAEAEKAIADDRNNPGALAQAGFYKMFLGRAEDGFAGVETALRLSPRDPNVTWWQYYICHFHSHLAQWEQAIEWCNKSVASGNETQWPYTDLAAAHGWLGHMKEAKEAAAQVLKYDPDFTIQGWMDSPLHDHWNGAPAFKAQLERIVEGARKAGIPEGEVKKE